ncbi:ABC transporter permease [Oceanospirillum sediminis]|uniref:ABC transporter permease n=1 Tax=Oceanospirillum sediminis TaxID=2760088 RepID=A0A839IUN6_9GAMM|nr:FtsX-like permease family protein [Oceanospirillum sediminis]MBB1488137.1 ABC transporter permease [Oceanospirillum sediminis]
MPDSTHSRLAGAPILRELVLILITHLQFYRRHLLLMLLFIVGLSAGTALITAIQGLNREAGDRYQTSTALMQQKVTHLIKPLTGDNELPGSLWLSLRRAGDFEVQPVLEGRLRLEHTERSYPSRGQGGQENSSHQAVHKPTGAPETLLIRGVNSLQWLTSASDDSSDQLDDFQSRLSDGQAVSLSYILLDRKLAERLGLSEQSLLNTLLPEAEKRDQQPLPDIPVFLIDDLGPWALMDMALADQLLRSKQQLSYLELSLSDQTRVRAEQEKQIRAIIHGQAQLVAVEQQPFNTLSSAFFFNLTALALLGYVVSAFLSYNAIRLMLSARKTLLTRMMQLGCRRRAVVQSLLLEMGTMSLVTALLGGVLGYLIANMLVLEVNSTLISLYELDRALTVQWQWSNVLIGFLLNLLALGTLLMGQYPGIMPLLRCLLWPVVLSAGLSTFLLWLYADTPLLAMLLCASVLLLFILLVLVFLRYIPTLALPEGHWLKLKHPLWIWLKADSQQHIQDMSVAIVAILIAAGTAIGMQVMVGSFSTALGMHLEQRLSADFYIRPEQPDPSMRQQLQAISGVRQVGVYHKSLVDLSQVDRASSDIDSEQNTEIKTATDSEGIKHSVDQKGSGEPIHTLSAELHTLSAELVSYGPDDRYFQHLSLAYSEDGHQKIGQKDISAGGCLANEPARLKYGLETGQRVFVYQHNARFSCVIQGFYYDYGAQQVTLAVAEPEHLATGMQYHTYGFSVSADEGIELTDLFRQIQNQLALPTEQIVENDRFKRLARNLFEDTFAVTHALNGFITAIALVGIWVSFLSLGDRQLSQLALLQALGIRQKQLLMVKLVQTGLMILLTLLFAIPLGVLLGVILLKFIMPIAFGWSMPVVIQVMPLTGFILLVLLVAVMVAFLPLLKLTRKSPADQLVSQT